MIVFTVYGRPIPQGSKRHVGNGRMIESSESLRPWRQEVTETAYVKYGRYTGNGMEPLVVDLRFYFQPPQKKRNLPTVKPDLDKLCRSILDSLTGIAYKDDAQVVEIHARKFYSLTPHVEIIVRPWEPEGD